jgi:hypothetical protein
MNSRCPGMMLVVEMEETGRRVGGRLGQGFGMEDRGWVEILGMVVGDGGGATASIGDRGSVNTATE